MTILASAPKLPQTTHSWSALSLIFPSVDAIEVGIERTIGTAIQIPQTAQLF